MTSATWLPTTPWLPVTAPCTGGAMFRTPELLERIVAQFELETSPRYQPRDLNADGRKETFCNVAAADITLALGCPIPRVWLSGATWREQRANDMHAWLSGPARTHGWSKINEHVAQAMANEGQVAVAIWRNPTGGSGHIAVAVPSGGEPGTWIAQAGATCFSRGLLIHGFGKLQPDFYGHP